MNEDEIRSKLAGVISRAWSDHHFWGRLKSDPRAALSEMGIDLDGKIDVNFHFDTQYKKNFSIPLPPNPTDVTDELKKLSAEHIAMPCTRTWTADC